MMKSNSHSTWSDEADTFQTSLQTQNFLASFIVQNAEIFLFKFGSRFLFSSLTERFSFFSKLFHKSVVTTSAAEGTAAKPKR